MRAGEYQDDYGPAVIGSAQPCGDDDETEYPAAIIYLPDPAERRGLLTRWVKKQKPAPIQRKAGFRP